MSIPCVLVRHTICVGCWICQLWDNNSISTNYHQETLTHLSTCKLYFTWGLDLLGVGLGVLLRPGILALIMHTVFQQPSFTPKVVNCETSKFVFCVIYNIDFVQILINLHRWVCNPAKFSPSTGTKAVQLNIEINK